MLLNWFFPQRANPCRFDFDIPYRLGFTELGSSLFELLIIGYRKVLRVFQFIKNILKQHKSALTYCIDNDLQVQSSMNNCREEKYNFRGGLPVEVTPFHNGHA